MTTAITGRYQPRHVAERRPMTFTSRYVAVCLILSALLFLIGVVGRVASGVWDIETVLGVGFLAWFAAFLVGVVKEGLP